jgi:hypothetical protein
MLPRVLLALLLFPALLRAEGPGVLVEGDMSQFAQDGDGRVWGIKDFRSDINLLVDSHWHVQQVPELDAGCRPVALEEFEDGEVGCLWRDPHEAEDAWVLTRHRGGQSIVARRFRAKLEQPAMLGVREGHVFITEAGRTFIAIFADDKDPEIIALPETLFVPPARKQSDGSISQEHAPLRAIVDLSGVVWLWSPETQRREWNWRLGGLVKMGDIVTDLKLCRLGEDTPAISVFTPWDENHLAVVAPGAGLYFLDQAKEQLAPATVPDAEAFKYIEQLFHDGNAWHAVTTPRPAETQVTAPGVLEGRIGISRTIFYDDTKPTCALWRQEEGVWKLVKNGLDKQPAVSREWLRTRAGLFLGSDSGPPWFFPANRGEARRISPVETFPLPFVEHMFQVSDAQVFFTYRHPTLGCLWPSDPPIIEEKPLRWERFVTTQRALQDKRGQIWCFRGAQTFVRWDGHEWKPIPPPSMEAVNACIDFALDDQDRGWLLHAHDAPTAICDFATGKWRSFPSVREAFVAQLPRGAKLSVPEYRFFEPAFSGDGRIGAFMNFDIVCLYEQRGWREWKFPDFAGPDARLGGTPFFAADGKFSVPVSASTAWQWHGESKGWHRCEGIDVPQPSTRPDREMLELPAGTNLQDITRDAIAQDRHGVFWFLRRGVELFKAVPGREVKVFDASEPNPFAHGGRISKALADVAGNVLLDTTEFSANHEQIFIRARLPVPDCSARLDRIEQDTAVLVVGAGNETSLWHSWRMDGGEWKPLSDKREFTLSGLLPGSHSVEVRAFNAELTPSSRTANVTFVTTSATDAQFAASLRDLASPEPDLREAAAHKLKSQGVSALPKLRAARDSASPAVRWWLDAIIQHIERQSAPAPK